VTFLLPLLLARAQAGTALPGFAAEPATSEPTLQVEGGLTQVQAGATAPLQLTVLVPPGFHVYRDMLSVTTQDPGDLSLGDPSLPPGLSAEDPAAPGTQRELYEFDVIVDVPLKKPARPGTHVATFSVRYQACKDSLCLMPRTEEVQARLEVAAVVTAGK